MGRALIMLAACLLASAVMAATLWWFFRRLNQIELQVWGAHLDTEGLRAAMERRRKRKAERRAVKTQKLERPG